MPVPDPGIIPTFPTPGPWPGGGTPTTVPPGAPNPFASGPYNTPQFMIPYDTTKFASKHDPKYDLLRLESLFDPRLGLTDDFMKALNAVGLGNFTKTSNDYVRLADGVPDWNGMTGADLILNEGSPDAKWAVQGDFPGDASGMTPDPRWAVQGDMPDMSWLSDLIKGLVRPPAAAPAPPPATTNTVVVPGLQASSQPSPSFGGGYVTPGYGAMGNATQLLSMALPRLLQDPNAANDPLIQQILHLVKTGGR